MMMFHPGMMRFARGVYRYLALCTLLGLLAAGVSVWRGFVTAAVMDGVFAGKDLAGLGPQLLLILGLVPTGCLLMWLRRGAGMLTAAKVKQVLRPRLFRKLAQLGPGYVARRGSGKVQAALVDGVEALEGYFGSYVPQVLVTLAAPTAILIYLFTLDHWVGASVLAAVAAALFLPKFWDKMLGAYGQDHWNAYAKLNGRFVDSMQGMTTLTVFNAAERRGGDLQEDAWRLYRATMRQLAVSLVNTGLVGFAMKGGSALALGVAAVRLSQGALTLEQLFVVLFLAGECIRPLAELDKAWHTGYMGISAAKGIGAILDAAPEVDPNGRTNISLPSQPEIVFEDVSFAYETRKGKVLDGFNMTAKAGETTALIGSSGAGKSTAAALLQRCYECSGNITIGGMPIRDISPTELRRHIAVVAQDTYLFYGTVADNLRLAAPDADMERLQAAAAAANAHSFIQALPEGYNTLIGERGVKLSGGERQRLAIARALLKNAPILILDEATASIDAANEADIQHALSVAADRRTTLVIAHRPNTIRDAHQIYVLDKGKVVASGNHQTLDATEGIYTRLLATQEESTCP